MVNPTPHRRSVIAYRWVICALLLCATTINYMDRQVLGVLAPYLQVEMGWSEVDYSLIVTSFQMAYAFGLLTVGWLIDRLGIRWGLILAVTTWSFAAMAHGWARTVTHFALARFALGIAEAGNFPASVKTVAEWFPKRERAFAIGIFNSGSNLGAIVTPLAVPVLVAAFGWRAAFWVIGGIGFLWVVLALVLFHSPEESRWSSAEERERVTSERESSVGQWSWRRVAFQRGTWAFATAKFLTDPIWWFYLYWTPKYLSEQFGVGLSGLVVPLVAVYLMADVGSVFGGWASARLIRNGMAVRVARTRVMLVCALMAVLVAFTPNAPTMWTAVGLLSLAAAAHQAWSANLFASVPDLFPAEAVASVTGFGGMFGAIGGMIIATLTGFVLEYTGSYTLLFALCGGVYLIAWSMFRFILSHDKGGC